VTTVLDPDLARAASARDTTGGGRALVDRVRADPPLTLVTAVTVVVLGYLAVLLLAGAVTLGVHPDEYIHVLRFDHWLDSGWYVPTSRLVDGMPDPNDPNASPYVYGAAFSWLAHLFNVALGNEAMGEIDATGPAYAVRHTVVALFGLGAAAAAAIAVRSITRDRLAALWTAAALLAIPVWTGNAMFNIKDIPVGASYTMLTAGLVLALVATDREEPQTAIRLLAAVAFVALGTFFGIGTRPAMWLPFALTVGAFVVLAAFTTRSSDRLLRSVMGPIGGAILGLCGIGLLHPKVTAHAWSWITESVSGSAEYDWTGLTLTAGQQLDGHPPPWYLPVWTFAALPLLIGAVAVLGVVVTVRSTRRLWPVTRAGQDPRSSRAAATLLVVLQLVFVPGASILTGATMYTGLRQHLYVLPAVAMLAGIGVAPLFRRIRRGADQRSAVRWALAGGLAVALLAPAVEQTRLHPYEYVYVNAAVGIDGVQANWETELQFLSSREAFRRVPASARPQCALYVTSITPEGDDGFGRCTIFLDPFRDEQGSDAVEDEVGDGVWVVGRVRGNAQPPEGCTVVDRITRPLRTEDLVMSYVLRCAGEEP
jgi:hypothetical protein